MLNELVIFEEEITVVFLSSIIAETANRGIDKFSMVAPKFAENFFSKCKSRWI